MLVVALQTPQPDLASGERRFVALLSLLVERFDVDFVALHRPKFDAPRYEDMLRSTGVSFKGYGQRQAQVALASRTYDVLFCEFYHVAEAVLNFAKVVQPHCAVVVDSVDVHFAREMGAAQLGELDPSIPETTRSAELGVYRAADLVLVVSEPDHDVLRNEGIERIAVVPNIVPVVERADRTREPIVLFVGAFSHAPNGHGIRWFVQHCWPGIRAKVPDARLVIVGRDPPTDIASFDGTSGISVTGFVPTTEPYLADAEVSVAPLLYGGGMKGKVSEALAHGVPIVTTSIGAQGLELPGEAPFLVADSADEFEASVVAVLTTPELRRRLSKDGQRVANRLCSTAAADAGLQSLLSLGGTPPGARAGLLPRFSRLLRYAGSRVMARVSRQRG